MSNDDRIMGIDELAAYLKMSRSTLYKISQEGKLPCQKVGRHWKYNRERIDEWIAQGGLNQNQSAGYGSQLGAPPVSQAPQATQSNDLKRYFSMKQVRLLNGQAIHSISDLLLSLATNQGKSALIEALGVTLEKFEEIATRIAKDLRGK